MNLFFSIIFLVAELSVILCYNCASNLFDDLKKEFVAKGKRPNDQCEILTLGVFGDGKFWSGLRYHDEYLFLADRECEEGKFDKYSTEVTFSMNDYVKSKVLNFCGDLKNFNMDCLKKFFSHQCNDARNESIKFINSEVELHSLSKGLQRKTPDVKNLYNFSSPFALSNLSLALPLKTANGKNETSQIMTTELSINGLGVSAQKFPVSFLKPKTFDNYSNFVSNISDYLHSPEPCGSFEKFFESHCYSLEKFTFRNKDFNRGDILYSYWWINSTQICRLRHPEALGLAVLKDTENHFVLEFLKNQSLGNQTLVMTAGIKKKNQPGQWQDWNVEVDKKAIDLVEPKIKATDDIFFYTISIANWTWQLLNLTTIVSINTNREWYFMCKRLYNPKKTDPELHKKCLNLYKDSKCYNPHKYVEYCCAMDENGDIWFECPSLICQKQYEDGSECAWICGDNGLFTREYPLCRKNMLCDRDFREIRYSAPAGRHATGRCPNFSVGYSTWYCNPNNTFKGLPNYVCCPENKMCKDIDSYLNIWASCSSQLAQKSVLCPRGSDVSRAIAEWYCREDLKFNGSSPNYSNCYKNANNAFCIKLDKYQRKWKVPRGSIADKPCPQSMKGICFWSCSVAGKFETLEPDCSKCHALWMDNVLEKIKNGTHYKVVMEEMKNHTQNEDLTIGFSHVLNLTTACVDLFKKEKLENKTVFNDFLIDYSKILKNIVGKPKIWSTFMVSSRKEYTSKILKTTQNATFAYLAFEPGVDERSVYNATFTDLRADGFDYFVIYDSSLTGTIFPTEKNSQSAWQLEIKNVNQTGTKFAAMGLVTNYSLSNLMFPLQNDSSGLKMNAPAISLTVATSEKNEVLVIPDVQVSVKFKHVRRTKQPKTEVIRRRLHKNEEPSGILGSTECYYLGYSEWTNKGCSVTSVTDQQTICSCTHLSTIGLLMSIHRYEPDTVLEMISLVSSSISIIALILALILFFAFDSIKNERILIGVNLCICLIVGHVLLVTVMDKTFFYFSDEWCTAYAILLHYVFMAAFAWMFVEGCHLYRMLVLVFESNIEFRFIYLVIGYGMPIPIILITEFTGFAFREQPYGQDELCWLKTPNYVWAFNGPVFVLTSINFVILIMAMKLAITSKMKTEKSNLTNLMMWIKGWVSLSVLLGITWLFGFAYTHYNQQFAYSFVILNGLQGLFIFIFRCLCNVQYKNALKQKLKSWFSKPDEFRNHENFKNVKLGSKLFALTQSGVKSTGSESDSSATSDATNKIRSSKSFFQKFMKSMNDFRHKHFKKKEYCSDTNLPCDGAIGRSDTTRSRLSATISNNDDDDDNYAKRQKAIWRTDQENYPELSYHMNYYAE